jgi:hypothetical protein
MVLREEQSGLGQVIYHSARCEGKDDGYRSPALIGSGRFQTMVSTAARRTGALFENAAPFDEPDRSGMAIILHEHHPKTAHPLA